MKTIGIRAIKVSSLILPGDWRQILSSEESKARGESIMADGLIHEPVVRQLSKGRYSIIAGRRRIAGMVQQGMEQIQVKVVDCTDDEADSWEEIENIERWHDPGEVALMRKRRLLRLQAKAIEEEGLAPAKAKSKAIEKVAKEKGVKPESVVQAEYRQRRKEREEKAAEVQDGAVDIQIEDWNMDLSDDGPWLESVKDIQNTIDDIVGRVRYAMNLMTRLGNDPRLPFPEGLCNRLRADLSDVASAVALARPTAVCPYCKLIEDVQARCAGCLTTGWMGDLAQVPKELKSGDPAMVSHGGKIIPADEFFE